MGDEFLPIRSPDKSQKLVEINCFYHIKYSVKKSLDKNQTLVLNLIYYAFLFLIVKDFLNCCCSNDSKEKQEPSYKDLVTAAINEVSISLIPPISTISTLEQLIIIQ